MPAKRSTSTKATSLKASVAPSAAPITKGERTRQAILEAAYRLFLEQGFAATSMRRIAEQAAAKGRHEDARPSGLQELTTRFVWGGLIVFLHGL